MKKRQDDLSFLSEEQGPPLCHPSAMLSELCNGPCCAEMEPQPTTDGQPLQADVRSDQPTVHKAEEAVNGLPEAKLKALRVGLGESALQHFDPHPHIAE